MDHDELRRYLDVSLAHSAVVDVREIPEAPGYLRTITVHNDYGVTIEFETCLQYVQGDWEGGILKYIGRYDTLEDVINDLEQYLGKPITAWQNYTRDPYEPKKLDEPDYESCKKYFEELVRSRRMDLPPRGDFRHAYAEWRHIEQYGEFRPDMIFEEQDLWLREQGIDPDDDDEPLDDKDDESDEKEPDVNEQA